MGRCCDSVSLLIGHSEVGTVSAIVRELGVPC